MKNLICSFIFLIFASAAQAADVNAICYTAVGGTTTFVIKTEGSKVNFEVFNHNGGGYAPFWSSIVVPNDLTILSKKAEIIKQLDRGFQTTWTTDQCKWTDKKKFACMGSTEPINVNGLEIEPWAVYTSVVNDSSFAGDYEYIDMTVSFEANKESLNYTMRYQADECIVQEEKINENAIKSLKSKK